MNFSAYSFLGGIFDEEQTLLPSLETLEERLSRGNYPPACKCLVLSEVNSSQNTLLPDILSSVHL